MLVLTVKTIGGVEAFLQEMLRRRDVLKGANRKRKPSVSTTYCPGGNIVIGCLTSF